MQIRQLHDLELAILPYPRHRRLHFLRLPSPDTNASFRCVFRVVQQQSLIADRPPRTRIHGVGAEEHVHGRDHVLALAVSAPSTPLDPHTRRPFLPLALPAAIPSRVQPPHLHIHNHSILRLQVLLPLALYVHIALGDPAGLEEEILLYPVPD